MDGRDVAELRFDCAGSFKWADGAKMAGVHAVLGTYNASLVLWQTA